MHTSYRLGLFGICSCVLALLLAGGVAVGFAQSRIHFNNQDVFLNGSNVAWVNFAGDLGPSALDTVRFKQAFDSVHVHGGNSFRLWLHTNGTQTPSFDGTGKVNGPGTKSIEYLTRILDLAWQRKIGLILCLWSFDMQRLSIGSTYVNRNAQMLNDTAFTGAYVRNGLVPLVTAVKGHPAIIAWEVFNEAEGMSNEFGWSDIGHVPMASIQRFTNLTAGAIHRIDSTAKVTTGAWALTAQTDVSLPAKPVDRLAAMSEAEKAALSREFLARHGVTMTAEEILARLSVANMNYYRDDRLIAAGGDSLGTLDFYCDHYYSNQGTALSPFLHPMASWGLTKPLVIAEFFPEATLSLPSTVLYDTLYRNGYAGAMSWGWYSGADGHNQDTLQKNTMALLQGLFDAYPEQIELSPVAGTIYAFTATPAVLDLGEQSVVSWKTALGSGPTLNGAPVAVRGTISVAPETTTTYTLITQGTRPDTMVATVQIQPSGRVISFSADPPAVAPGERVLLHWRASRGSTVRLNDSTVAVADSLVVRPTVTTTYALAAQGAIRDTARLTIAVRSADSLNRALGRPAFASKSDSDPAYADPAHCTDGDTTTQWKSGTGSLLSVVVDLGMAINVQRLAIAWGASFPASFTISLLGTDGYWHAVRSVSGNIGGRELIDGIGQTGTRVQVRFNATVGILIRELEIYGTQSPETSAGGPAQLPVAYALLQNFPNPFNPSTTFRIALPVRSRVELTVFNILGEEVAHVFSGMLDAGTADVNWRAALPSGAYVCRMTAVPDVGSGPGYTGVTKLLLVR